MRAAAGWCAGVLGLVVFAGRPGTAVGQDLVATTPPRTPQEELKSFKLPPGFEIQLVAADPDIKKPMNLAFDAKGRLWVTETIEYPYPAPADRTPRDGIKIIDQIGLDGRAGKITRFADGLNIPIGVLPIATADGHDTVLVHSIPDILRLTDTDGDGKADKREVAIGSIGYKDTHGMTNHFTPGFDGWIYACHGFSNTSTLKAKDDSEITMNSGNVYRFRPDGSHVEYFTHGQVNPFGLTFDPLGNLYSADCHSRPQYMLLRGGYYPSFGKPHDGLGYAPEMCMHDHGSTAISGTICYAAEQFPPEWRGTLFNGNVVTNRINHDNLEVRGSTRVAIETADFLVSDDPWFRPVDLVTGPDGAIYVADFYNRIIGHYEVPLDHPGRDRERGRIWRIVYRGDGKTEAPSPQASNLAAADVNGLVAALAHPNLAVRTLATEQLVGRVGESAADAIRAAVDQPKNPRQRVHGLWALSRLGKLEPKTLQAAAADADVEVRTHVQRILSETPTWSEADRALALAALKDADANVRRAAADGLGRHPDAANVDPLLATLQSTDSQDTHLRYVLRMALRDQMLVDSIAGQLPKAQWTPADRRATADVALGAASSGAATYLLHFIQESDDRALTGDALRHIARNLPPSELGNLVEMAKTRFAKDIDFQLGLLQAVREGLAQRGGETPAVVGRWGHEIARTLLQAPPGDAEGWKTTPIEGGSGKSPWVIQRRASADGDKDAKFWSSLPLGEQLTGVLRSPEFDIPQKLSFFYAGHSELPGTNAPPKNFVRLREAGTNAVLAEAVPPRNDIAQRMEWDLSKAAGKRGYLEAIDAISADGYAWIAFGRFEPAVVPLPSVSPDTQRRRLREGAEIAGATKASDLAPELQRLAQSPDADADGRAAAVSALSSIDRAGNLQLFAALTNDHAVPAAVLNAAAGALAATNSNDARLALATALASSPHGAQLAIATAMTGDAAGVQSLLNAVEQGKASPRLLMEPAIQARLKANGPADLEKRVAVLTRNVEPMSQELQKLIDQRRREFSSGSASAERGHQVFVKNCAVCHRAANEGATIGPQLDGVSKRGPDRIIEDILDPNRNIDGAFRVTIYQLKDGQTVAGLLRRKDGGQIVIADSTGKESSFREADVKRSAGSTLSLMPSNFGEVIPVAEFNDLLSFLLSK